MQVLHALVTGAPPATHAGELVDAAVRDGWSVHVVASPAAVRFIDQPELAARSGNPVRVDYRQPGAPDPLPPADACVVAPATANTLVKWALGISDTLPLGLLVQGVASNLPTVAVPFANWAHLAHPGVVTAIARLRSFGVVVLTGDDVVPRHDPGPSEAYAAAFPWPRIWHELRRHPGLARAR